MTGVAQPVAGSSGADPEATQPGPDYRQPLYGRRSGRASPLDRPVIPTCVLPFEPDSFFLLAGLHGRCCYPDEGAEQHDVRDVGQQNAQARRDTIVRR